LTQFSPHSKDILAGLIGDLLSLEAVLDSPIFTFNSRDPKRQLKLSILAIAIDVLSADGELDDDEVVILIDLAEVLAYFHFSDLTEELLEAKGFKEAVLPDLRDSFMTLLRDNPNIYELQIPGFVSLFEIYDSANRTSLAELLRSMYSRFAAVCADYDRPINESERAVLSALETALYPKSK